MTFFLIWSRFWAIWPTVGPSPLLNFDGPYHVSEIPNWIKYAECLFLLSQRKCSTLLCRRHLSEPSTNSGLRETFLSSTSSPSYLISITLGLTKNIFGEFHLPLLVYLSFISSILLEMGIYLRMCPVEFFLTQFTRRFWEEPQTPYTWLMYS